MLLLDAGAEGRERRGLSDKGWTSLLHSVLALLRYAFMPYAE